jgi:hypothetical protein
MTIAVAEPTQIDSGIFDLATLGRFLGFPLTLTCEVFEPKKENEIRA